MWNVFKSHVLRRHVFIFSSYLSILKLLFATMGLLRLAPWLLMLVLVAGEYHGFGDTSNHQSANGLRYKQAPKFETLTLKVRINGKSIVINLVPTNQLLANEHLPVWLSPATSPNGKYFRHPHVMKKDVGHFTMYHDYATKSALVYFHKRRELDGIIEMIYKIEGLSIDKLDEEYIIDEGYRRFLNVWKYLEKLGLRKKPSRTGIAVQNEQSRPKVYPELLIAVSNDMMNKIESNSKYPALVKTISHVITSYNAADMLFKFLQCADISLNIAAIVFETGKHEWGLLTKGPGFYFADSEKINHQVKSLFQSKENIFRRYSYDYVAYHTRAPLLFVKTFPIHGISIVNYDDFRPMFLHSTYGYRPNIAVVDHESYKHYATIAHELSHIFGAEHDHIFNWFYQNPADRGIMAAWGIPNMSLKWGDATEKELEKFFSSPAHCILENKPQSLLPAKPRITLTAEQQCRCFGYESADEKSKATMGFCSTILRCSSGNGELSTDLPLPMDGTPVDDEFNSVCWEKDVVAIGG